MIITAFPNRRHKDSVVVYDPASKQLVVRNAPVQNELDLTECPYCHRPMREEARDAGDPNHGSSTSAAASFASPEYFRMLHHSLPGSNESSSPPSPRRRLTNPVLSGRGTPNYPPPGAEFVASSPASPPSPQGISSTAFSPNYFTRFFIEERELGRGGKGVVLLVKHVLDGVSLGHFALKRIPVGDDHEWLEKVLIEVQLLQHLSHQNLVSYRHVWLEDAKLNNFGPSIPCAFVLQQYCNAGDLHNYICSSAEARITTEQLKNRIRRRSKHQPEPPEDLHGPRKLQFEEIYSFFKDITSGLNHLHVNGYIHRDLKPSNCLLHDTGNEIRVLVSDFGEVQAESMARRSTGATGTISYCAPEVLRRDYSTGSFGNFTTKSDVFSLGMILYFLCFAQLPYRNADNMNEENEDIDELRAEISTWQGLEDQRDMRPDLPEKLYKFLRRLLSLDPTSRPTAEEILHGIKTGSGLEESTDTRPRPTSHFFEEVRNSSRISPADTPADGSPMPKSPGQKPSNIFRAAPPGKLRLSPLHESRRNSSSRAADDGNTATSPGGSLVLRSPHTSPVKLADPPIVLNPPTSRFYFQNPRTLHTWKIVFFLLKILSISLPCAPVAAKPGTALPLLGLATLDLLLDGFGIYIPLLLALMHGMTLYGTMKAGVLCFPKASLWAADV